jgi:pimeloyl-ACP methyl ester carboxylesterase
VRVAKDVRSRWFNDGRIPMRTRLIHGYRRSFLVAGEGPPLLLIHGVGDSSQAWRDVIPMLAENHLVIAPDLLGHGASDKPRADYSISAYANGMRDLLTVLGIDKVTLVGHSFGGGVAMQFAYQYPARVDRLVLVSSGGAGRSVSPFLRAASLPGAHLALAGLRAPLARGAVGAGIDVLRRLDTGLGIDAIDAMRVINALPDRTARSAFVRTLRSAVDWRGQVVTMLDRAYLARNMPTLVVWGAKDSILPVGHARRVHAAMPGSKLEIFANAAHFPFRTDPQRFVDLLEDFCTQTAPSSYDLDDWRAVLRAGYADPLEPVYSSYLRGELRHESERSAT